MNRLRNITLGRALAWSHSYHKISEVQPDLFLARLKDLRRMQHVLGQKQPWVVNRETLLLQRVSRLLLYEYLCYTV
jgi:hypothetical protein